MKALHALLAGCLATLSSTSAQTTHDVSLFNLSYAPNQLTVELGDTVRWTWVSGFHDVVSGLDLVPNGIFASLLTETPGFTFEVTFDQAFLAANPVPGNDYFYYCSVHEPLGMVGVVRVDVPSSFDAYGCGTNPAGSLVRLSGAAQLGGAITLGVDNPLGSQPVGSLAFLAVATAPDPGFPCGTLLPGLGMDGPYGPGELLISIASPNPVVLLGPVLWSGSAAAFPVGIPSAPSFLGLDFYFQGVVAEPSGPFALTEGAVVRIGE